jgi:hypothetical protein
MLKMVIFGAVLIQKKERKKKRVAPWPASHSARPYGRSKRAYHPTHLLPPLSPSLVAVAPWRHCRRRRAPLQCVSAAPARLPPLRTLVLTSTVDRAGNGHGLSSFRAGRHGRSLQSTPLARSALSSSFFLRASSPPRPRDARTPRRGQERRATAEQCPPRCHGHWQTCAGGPLARSLARSLRLVAGSMPVPTSSPEISPAVRSGQSAPLPCSV